LFTAPTVAPVQLQLRLVDFYLRPGPVTPWALACQCRAVGYGAAEPATSPIVATSSAHRATMHGTAREIDAGKSVSFGKIK